MDIDIVEINPGLYPERKGGCMEAHMGDGAVSGLLGYSNAWWSSLDAGERTILLNGGFAMRFAFHSGRMENIGITWCLTLQLFEDGKSPSYSEDDLALREVFNLRRSWESALDLAVSSGPLTVDSLLSLHRDLVDGTYDDARLMAGERPGSFKRGEYIVGDDVGYPACDVPSAIEGLLADLNQFFQKQPFSPEQAWTASCFAHAMVADIHPFADGNGRLARLLQNFVLIRCGLPPLAIDVADRMAYYGALDAFHADGNLEDLKAFCAACLSKTWDAQIERFLNRGPCADL